MPLQQVKQIKFYVLDKIIVKNRDHGGVVVGAYGEMGSGKTTLLLRLAEQMVMRGEKVIWRGMHSCQWLYSPVPVNLLLPKNAETTLTVMDRIEDKTVGDFAPQELLGQFFDRLSFYTSIESIYSKVKKNYLNAVYFLDIYDWLDFFKLLLLRKDVNWISIFFDEVEDIFPMNPSGEAWTKCEKGSKLIKEFRKNYISLYMASQQPSKIDYRILFNVQFDIYLKGAKVRKGSIVDPELVKTGLKKGEAVIEGDNYEIFTFEKIDKPRYALKISLRAEGDSPSI